LIDRAALAIIKTTNLIVKFNSSTSFKIALLGKFFWLWARQPLAGTGSSMKGLSCLQDQDSFHQEMHNQGRLNHPLNGNVHRLNNRSIEDSVGTSGQYKLQSRFPSILQLINLCSVYLLIFS